MTASRLNLIPFLCLFCTAVSSQEAKTVVVWKRAGEDYTIQCRQPGEGQESLTLRRGIKKSDLVFMYPGDEPELIKHELKDRLQINGPFPNPDFLIKNLTSNDTGPYWCLYSKTDKKLNAVQEKEGTGSVLLVVSADLLIDKDRECTPSIKDPVLVSIVIAAVVLCVILLGLILWVIKTKTLHSTQKPRRVTTNDVYEDMRGTLRR